MKESRSSFSSGKKPKGSNSRGFQGQGLGQSKASSQAGQVICFHYQQPKHMRRDFPQRQGSQGFETVQS